MKVENFINHILTSKHLFECLQNRFVFKTMVNNNYKLNNTGVSNAVDTVDLQDIGGTTIKKDSLLI